MLGAVADLHAAFLGSAPEGLTQLGSVLSLFEPRRIRPYAGESLVDYALRGWEYWPEVAPGEVGERVLAAGPGHRTPRGGMPGAADDPRARRPRDREHGLRARPTRVPDPHRLGSGRGGTRRARRRPAAGRLRAPVRSARWPSGERRDRGHGSTASSPCSARPPARVRRRGPAAGPARRSHLAGLEQVARHRRAPGPGRARAGTGRVDRGGCSKPSWPSRPASSEGRQRNGCQHALPTDGRALRRPCQRSPGRAMGDPTPVRGVDRARPGQPCDLREPLDRPAHQGRAPSTRSATALTGTCSATDAALRCRRLGGGPLPRVSAAGGRSVALERSARRAELCQLRSQTDRQAGCARCDVVGPSDGPARPRLLVITSRATGCRPARLEPISRGAVPTAGSRRAREGAPRTAARLPTIHVLATLELARPAPPTPTRRRTSQVWRTYWQPSSASHHAPRSRASRPSATSSRREYESIRGSSAARPGQATPSWSPLAADRRREAGLKAHRDRATQHRCPFLEHVLVSRA